MQILKKNSIGLDISDKTIEVVEVEKRGSEYKIISKGRLILEDDIVERGRIKNEKKLSEAINKVLENAKPAPITKKEIIFGLPESQVYTHVFSVEKSKEDDREEIIKNEVESSIPINKINLSYSYSILNESDSSIEILAVAAKRNVIKEWYEFFNKNKFKIDFFDIETLAVLRDLFKEKPREPVCVVDLGAETTNVIIYYKNGFEYSFTIDIAGNDFTKIIASRYGINFKEAEEKKKKSGLSLSNEEAIRDLKNLLDLIIADMRATIEYFENKSDKRIENIILIGGSSRLNGLMEYFKNHIGLNIKIGEVNLIKDISLKYLGAIGLALKAIDKKYSNDPVLKLEETKKSGSGRLNIFKSKKNKFFSSQKGNQPAMLRIAMQAGKKQKLEIILLLFIIISGIVIVGLTYKYSNRNNNNEVNNVSGGYNKNQTIIVKVPIAVKEEEYREGLISGRIIEVEVDEVKDNDLAIEESRIKAESSIKEGEKIILSVAEKNKDDNLLKIKWIVYPENEAKSLILNKINEINTDNIQYLINNININEVEATENLLIYYINGEVDISLDEFINIK